MPSKKQRRRREKDRRHDYEYVYVDESGTEVEVEEAEPAETRKNGAKGAEPLRASAKPSKGGKQQPRSTGGRVVQPPSWERVIKRTAIFVPIMFVAIYMLERDIGITAQLLVTAQMLLIFVPFSYLMDRMMYRRHLRQTGQEPAKSSRR